ncbi:MAG TPA: 50S ribosomal protein L10 [Candidatus Dependentiae bacterium]|nr:50S ribosomal protein L10 [Candidatus Dependentiae bacterium]HRQ62248.1 50S ribosomal protein L10 [Candidatus Dependentiae bacterium]
MALNRQQKDQVIQELRNDFASSNASFLVGYQGLTVDQMQTLRTELRKQGGRLQVAKARLMKRAAEGIDGAQDIAEHFKNQVGLVFAAGEVPAIAKVLHTFAKNNVALVLKVGYIDSQVLDERGILRIAQLPSREVLLAQVCRGIQAPSSNLVRVMHTSIVRLLWVLQEIQNKKQS